jgi:hypothetical protein
MRARGFSKNSQIGVQARDLNGRLGGSRSKAWSNRNSAVPTVAPVLRIPVRFPLQPFANGGQGKAISL